MVILRGASKKSFFRPFGDERLGDVDLFSGVVYFSLENNELGDAKVCQRKNDHGDREC